MNKQSLITILLTVLMSMTGAKAFAFSVENSDGVTINYNWVDEELSSLAVTYGFSWEKYKGDINIPESVEYNGKIYKVTSIGGAAFQNCTELTSVSIPNTVTSIDQYAFNGCSNLTSVNIPNGVTEIGDGAFSQCNSLKSVILPNCLTSIGSSIFWGCNGLTSITIPENVTIIGGSAFSSCTNLASITFSNKISYVGNSAFYETAWYKNQPDGIVYVGKVAYEYKGKMAENTTLTINDGTTAITDGAFLGFKELKTINLPNGLKSIGSSAFADCTGLEKITIPNSVTKIGEGIFDRCYNLSIVISKIANPFEVSNLIYNYNNSSITLIVPNGTKSAYKSTAGWSDFSIVEEGEGGVSGNKYEIDDICYIIGENNTLTVTSKNNKYEGNVFIPSQVNINGKSYSVTAIESYAFDNCTDLLSVSIPNSVTTINNYAFRYCYNLSSLTIGSGVTNISYDAFNSSYVSKVIWLTNTPPSGYNYVHGTINYVSNDQFTSLSNKVIYPFLSSMFEVDGIRYVPVSLSERTCDAIDCVYDESASITKLGSTVTYKGVTLTVQNIQPYICHKNIYINHLTMDISGAINTSAFYGCSNMQTAILGKTNNDVDKDKFTGIYIGSNITSIGDWVFYGCESLNKINIADRESELTFGSNDNSPIFGSCPLESVYIGGNITYSKESNKGYSPFYRNTAIRSVTITDKETEISQNEFYGCTNLQRVTIGDGVTDIGDWAFSGCQSLSYFAFGSKLQNIGTEAFSDCTQVGEIISKAKTAPICGSQALDDINKWECKLYVPEGTKSLYQKADQWKEFLFAEEGTGTAEQNPSGEGPLKCGTPNITYSGDKISFTCETEGVKYFYRITGSDVKAGNGSEVGLQKKYTISVYATKEGYVDSDVVKSTIEIGGSGVFGDLTGDGVVNVADHVKLSDIIMNK